MDGIHDMGGMDGFGAVHVESDEPVFHHEWEGRVLATLVTLFCQGELNPHEFRHARERVRPHPYLASSYYELMLRGIETLLVEDGVVDPERIAERAAAFDAGEADLPERADPDLVEDLREFVRTGGTGPRAPQPPAFEPGDQVVVRNDHPEGHTRAPRYARRAEGVVESVQGTFEVADARARGEDAAEPVYNVRFPAKELWGPQGDDAANVRLDMWERYLRPADSDDR